MLEPLRMLCPKCKARLRAARQLVGQLCPCPRCGTHVMVQIPVPSDADVTLVFPDEPRHAMGHFGR